ncbi:MAG TPA: nucleotide exchange factor GrpE [Nitrososphaeraceae archaeon]|nr:nucleotide exchange factor GrpE [Nitrososphaeraceae archaeon]
MDDGERGREEEEQIAEDELNRTHDGEDEEELDDKKELSKLREDLKRARESADNNLNKLRYMMADFDNYRKQMEKQFHSKVEASKAEILLKFLNIRDDYLRALEMVRQNKSDAVIIEGLQGILKNFDNLLSSEGVIEIESVGTPFDPNIHDAINFTYSDDLPEDTVTKEIRKGYMLNNKVLRPSIVETSKKIVKNTANATEKLQKKSDT